MAARMSISFMQYQRKAKYQTMPECQGTEKKGIFRLQGNRFYKNVLIQSSSMTTVSKFQRHCDTLKMQCILVSLRTT